MMKPASRCWKNAIAGCLLIGSVSLAVARADVAPAAPAWIAGALAEVNRETAEVGARDRGFAGMWRIGGKTNQGVGYDGLVNVRRLSATEFELRGSTRFPDGNVISWLGTGHSEGGILKIRYESRTGGRGTGELTLLSNRSAKCAWTSLATPGSGGEEVLARDDALERRHLAQRRAELTEAARPSVPASSADATAPLVTADGRLRAALSPMPQAGLSQEWVRFIDATRTSLDIAVFEFRLPCVTDAVLRAQARGVRVRFVTDSDNLGAETARLAKAGLPVVTDGRKPYMHDKFMVGDGGRVLTGSYNPTPVGENRSDNNIVVVDSPELARNYTLEFEEMFVGRAFGPTSPQNTSDAPIRVGRRAAGAPATTVRVLFAPEDGVKRALLEVLRQAKKSIDFMSFTINEASIAGTLAEKHLEGLRVRGVVERFKSGDAAHSQFGFLRRCEVPVRMDRSTNILHHKVIIVDEESVILTGSYNFSDSAEHANDENLLMIFNREVARRFLDGFEELWSAGEDPGPLPAGGPGVVERLESETR